MATRVSSCTMRSKKVLLVSPRARAMLKPRCPSGRGRARK